MGIPAPSAKTEAAPVRGSLLVVSRNGRKLTEPIKQVLMRRTCKG